MLRIGAKPHVYLGFGIIAALSIENEDLGETCLVESALRKNRKRLERQLDS